MDEIEHLQAELHRRDIKIEQLEAIVGAFMKVVTDSQFATVRGMIELGDLSIPR
jgi:hypothetical protein